MFTHILNKSWSTGAPADSVNASVSVSADGEDNRDVALGASLSDVVVNLAAAYLKLKSLCIGSDVDVTVDTYLLTVKKNTIVVPAGSMFVWMYGDVSANPLSSDFDSVKLSNGGDVAGTVKIRMLVDSTPA